MFIRKKYFLRYASRQRNIYEWKTEKFIKINKKATGHEKKIPTHCCTYKSFNKILLIETLSKQFPLLHQQ